MRPPPPFGLTVNFWDKFCTVFVSFVSRLTVKFVSNKRRVKNYAKMYPDLSFSGHILFFSGEVAQPPPPHHTSLGAYGASSPY